MNLDVRSVSPILGAEIFGVDLSAPLDDETFDAVHQAFLDHGVLFFKGQDELSASAQVAFASRFGPLHTHPAAPAETAESSVFVIHAHKDSTVANGNGWHTDVSCDLEPPMATMLQIHQLPEGGGGDTLFTNTATAYETLPLSDREYLRTLRAVHVSEHVYTGRYADRGVADEDASFPSAEHPLVRSHPETGRLSLYVNPSFTSHIVDYERDESEALLQRLFTHIERPEFQIRFRWNQNDVAIWDNRCLQHFAVWDYWPNERKGNRVSVAGDRPFHDLDAPEPPDSQMRVSVGALASRPT